PMNTIPFESQRVEALMPNVGFCVSELFVLSPKTMIWFAFVGSAVARQNTPLMVELNVVVELWIALATKTTGVDEAENDPGAGLDEVPFALFVEPTVHAPPVYCAAQRLKLGVPLKLMLTR